MKIFYKISIVTVFVVSLAFGLTGLITTLAATSPTLVGSDSYSVLGATTVTCTGATTVTGNVGVAAGTAITGFPSPCTVSPGTTQSNTPSAIAAQADNLIAFNTLNQGCDHSYADGQDLSSLSPLGPGVYCSAGSFLLTTNLTLTGSGVWIFKTVSSLITSPGSSITGGDSCNVWWRVGSSATLDTTTSFKGNILALTSIWMNTGASLNGRAMAQTGEVTLNANAISGPTCAAAPEATPESGGSIRRTGTITVVKMVINDNGGTKTVNDFPLFVNNTLVASMVTNTFSTPAGVYSVTETVDSNYTRTFSGDCDINGQLNLNTNENKFCIITNDDIGVPVIVPPVPPLIDVVKVPSPLALPAGPGSVTYTYTLRNIGTVPVTNVTMVGDTCSPITLVFGDINADAKLDVNETWTYRCSTTLSETHTNTVVATGWANGLTATDIASATVVVGVSTVPPLIHVTKVPSPLTLLAGGGMVTYTKKVTNPGTVALSNVRLTDDKCDSVKYISGDTNGDSKLDITETWIYTCQTNLTKTTTNTVTASGDANGLTARDFAIATVVVVPGQVLGATTPNLPNTGFPPEGKSISWNIVILAGIFTVSILFYFIRRKQTA